MGRSDDDIWQHWTSLSASPGKRTKVQCNYCNGAIQYKHSGKCRRHTFKTCKKTPWSVRDGHSKRPTSDEAANAVAEIVWSAPEEGTSQLSEADHSTMDGETSSATANIPSSPAMQAVRTQASNEARKQRKLQQMLIKALISGRVSLDFLNNREFRQFMSAAAPGVHLPTEAAARQMILDHLTDSTF